jgi:hypothetical protein
MLLLWIALAVLGGLLIIRSRKNLSILPRYLNFISITLVVISIVNIGIYEMRNLNLGYEELNGESESSGLQKTGVLPDIYYIILDGYSREDILQEDYNHNNSKFTEYLGSIGFFIANKSCSNYGGTVSSLASSLNMAYLTPEVQASKALQLEMIRNSKVSRLLKQIGYQYIYIGGDFEIKYMGKYADSYIYQESFGIRTSPFVSSLCDTTLLMPFSRFFGSHGANSILYAFDTLANIPAIEEPTFVYAHIKCPHPPALFDSAGPIEFPAFEPETVSEEFSRQGYLGNLTFINRKIETLIDRILAESDNSPIIILQGDHGIRPTEQGKMSWIHEILNVYYLPDSNNQFLYNTISPVNSFRVIFNLYFNTDYKLLKDETS